MLAAAPVHQVTVGAETAIPLSTTLVLVASQSDPGGWYAVEGTGEAARCQCPGFTHRGTCRHLAIAAQASAIPGFEALVGDATPEPVSEPAPAMVACGACGNPALAASAPGFARCHTCITKLLTMPDDDQ